MDQMPNDFDFSNMETFLADQEPRAGQLNGRALVEAAAEAFGEDFREVLVHIRECKGHVAGLCCGPSNEDGRRRLHNAKLKTTYFADVRRGLTALSLRYRAELAKQLPELMELALKLEESEIHLAEAYRLERELIDQKQEQKKTGLYPNVAAAADILFDKHRVTHWHWSAADDQQLARIAAILHEKIDRSSR